MPSSMIQPISVEEEYKKNAGELHKKDVQALQEWMDKQPHLPKISELEIILFLYSCYCRIELAKTTIDIFFTCRTHVPEFFANRSAHNKNVREALDIVTMAVLPEVTPEGYRVFTLTFAIPDPARFNLADCTKVFTMIMDLDLLVNGTAKGHVIYLDMVGVTLGHVAKLGVMVIKQILFYLQEALPFRLKGLHFVNAVPFMDKILFLMKPFMKKELMEMLFIHPKASTFYEKVPQKILPKELGGEAPSYAVLQAKTLELLLENDQWFIDEERTHRVNEQKRPGKAKNAGDLFGVEGSFKTLSID